MAKRSPERLAPDPAGQSAAGPAGDPPRPCDFAVPLAELTRGDVAVIDRLDLPDAEAARLLRLGLVPGRGITVMRSGPRPMVATAGARLALDRTLARGVMVVKDGTAGAADNQDLLPDAALPGAFEPDEQEAPR